MNPAAELYRRQLVDTRIEKDRMQVQLAIAVEKSGRLEQENEALREFVAYLAVSVTR